MCLRLLYVEGLLTYCIGTGSCQGHDGRGEMAEAVELSCGEAGIFFRSP